MPIYEYQCQDCLRKHEVMQKFSDEPLSVCPVCGGSLRKLISNTSFVLKGTGWYKTDYASPDRKKSEGAEKESPAAKESTSPEQKKEAKQEQKTETKKDAVPSE